MILTSYGFRMLQISDGVRARAFDHEGLAQGMPIVWRSLGSLRIPYCFSVSSISIRPEQFLNERSYIPMRSVHRAQSIRGSAEFCNVYSARMPIHRINSHMLGTKFWIPAYIISHPSLVTCRSR